MAGWDIRPFDSLNRVRDYLNGVIIGTVDLSDGANVDTKTLVIDVDGGGNRTVTFAPAKSRDWTLAEIVAQIEAAHADLVGVPVVYIDAAPGGAVGPKFLVLVKDGSVITIQNTGTANTVLGFPAPQTIGDPVAIAELHSLVRDPDNMGRWVTAVYR